MHPLVIELHPTIQVPKEERRLQEALRVSCLDDDLKIMPAGIQTEIGIFVNNSFVMQGIIY